MVKGAEGFWVAELQVRQPKIGRKSCFDIKLFQDQILDQIYLCAVNKSWEREYFENPKFKNHQSPIRYGFYNSAVSCGHKNRTIWGVPVQEITVLIFTYTVS